MADRYQFNIMLSASRKHRMQYQNWRKRIAALDTVICGICGQVIDINATDDMRLSRDHIIPRSKGGTDHKNNLQPSHHRCNQLKADTVK